MKTSKDFGNFENPNLDAISEQIEVVLYNTYPSALNVAFDNFKQLQPAQERRKQR